MSCIIYIYIRIKCSTCWSRKSLFSLSSKVCLPWKRSKRSDGVQGALSEYSEAITWCSETETVCVLEKRWLNLFRASLRQLAHSLALYPAVSDETRRRAISSASWLSRDSRLSLKLKNPLKGTEFEKVMDIKWNATLFSVLSTGRVLWMNLKNSAPIRN